jgi:small nuclear ribonucleoprotein (snRNP)-like protein
MTTKEKDQKAVVQETKSGAERHGPQFIPKLKGKKVIIRLISGGQPVTGTIEGYNPQEILIQTAKGSS